MLTEKEMQMRSIYRGAFPSQYENPTLIQDLTKSWIFD